MEVSANDEEEGRIIRQRIDEDEEIETGRAKEDGLTMAERKRRELEEDDDKILDEKCEIKKLDAQPARSSREIFKEKGQVNLSKDYVEEDANPPPSTCNCCNSEIEDGLSLCLCCLHSHKPTAKAEVSNSKGKFQRPCYKKPRRPSCYICRQRIPSSEEGIKYHMHPFWEEKYCPSHDRDGTLKCCSCERLQACGTEYEMLADNRWLCIECKECAVMDTDECQALHFEMREFFKGLNMEVEKEFPLLLVEKQVLNKTEDEKIYGIVTRGICLSQEKMVTRVPRGPNKQLIRECEVTAVLILYGLPRLLTGYILAHEMMHAYLRLKGYRNLNTALEEGLCQVVAHKWLESQRCSSPNDASAAACSRTPPPTTSKKGDKSAFEKKLVEFCINQIETDELPVYGDGFKKVNEMMVSNHYNLKDALKDIAINASLKSSLPPYSKF